MQNRIFLSRVAIVFFVMALPAAGWCGSFTVNPVRIQVSSSRPNAILQINNRDDQSVTLQVHVVTWSLDGQKDVYSDSNDVMLNPPIAVVGPHQTQFIRLGLRHPLEGSEERTYRLIVEEVPPPPKPDFRGIQTLLRISIPIFVVPKSAAAPAPQVNWHAERTSDSRVRLVATNRGSAHVQVKALEVSSADSPDSYLKGAPPTYLLPTQQREWLIDDKRTLTARRIKILAVTDAGVLHEIVEIAQ
jgi:fimbrial chaperone protein